MTQILAPSHRVTALRASAGVAPNDAAFAPARSPVRFWRALLNTQSFGAELGGLTRRRSLEDDLLKQRQPIFLSPHRDDVCFSLGALALRLQRGVLINLFTKSQYVADKSRYGNPDAEAVGAIRAAEDRQFAERCGLRVVDLGLEEPPLKGRAPFDLAGVEDDRAALAPPLMERLMALEPVGGSHERAMLFCPAAIGGHSNHVATMLAVAEAMPTLEQRFRILFYEDLHYASSGRKRRAGLARLLSLMDGRRPVRHTIPLRTDAGAKLGIVRLYRSQFAELPGNLRRFTPRTWLPAGPHEAAWEFVDR